MHYVLFQEGSLISFKFTSYYFSLRNVKRLQFHGSPTESELIIIKSRYLNTVVKLDCVSWGGQIQKLPFKRNCFHLLS